MRAAIVIGGANCVSLDFSSALELFTPDRVYAVNDIGAHVEKIDVWCTLHPECLDFWEEQRRKRGLDNNYEIVAPLISEVGIHIDKGRINRRVSYIWPGLNIDSSPSSGIYAAKVALEDGFDRVVLAGVPLTVEHGHFLPSSRNSKGEMRGKVWKDCGAFVSGFNKSLPYLNGRVRSMSGYTKEILGKPDAEWLGNFFGEADKVVGGCPVNGE